MTCSHFWNFSNAPPGNKIWFEKENVKERVSQYLNYNISCLNIFCPLCRNQVQSDHLYFFKYTFHLESDYFLFVEQTKQT